ncbi:MAG: DUF2946 domain-containing protein [Caldimonas sp.]
MRLRRPALRIVCWIAFAAVALATLVPTLSQAFRGSDNRGWAEVCSASGVKWLRVSASAAEEPPAPQHPHALQHCAFCATHVAWALPPAVQAGAPLLALGRAAPRVVFVAPRTRFAWRAAQPRGPPAA